ncbi:hypothetical protein LCGC14_0682180 [marine sediment metagenome]|uniref:Glycosyltransferase RgtA/B/C/D-like domain-containing protein n=1 Tax=marine sediment metagenome TaxID=412755 RepID=A0A0F9QMX1_9ZZZZ
MMKINIKDNLFPSSFYIAFFLISILIVFNENICRLIIRIFTNNLADMPFELVVSTFDRILYFLLFGYFILSFVYIIYTENRDKNNFFNKIFPGFFCLIFPFFFQLIILRYQYLFLWDDAGQYVSIGINLFSGYGLSSGISGALGGAYFPYLPFSIYQYSHYLSSIFFGLFWEIFHSLKGIMLSVVLLESINCFLLYKISKKLFKSNFYSAAASFLYFSIVLYILPLRESLQPIYDQPFSTLVFLLVYLLNKEFVTLKKAFLLGLLLGIGVLIKITSLFVLFILVLSFLLYFPKNLKLRLKTAFLATVGFLLFFIPYQIYCLQSRGEVFPSKLTSSFYSLDYILKNNKAGDTLFYKKKENLINAKDTNVLSSSENIEIPIVISPMGDEVVERRPRFHWTEVKGASNYEIEITTDGGASKIEDNYSYKTILSLNHDLPHTRLRWRVRAWKDMATGKWSPWAYFTPEDTLEQAYVISPKDDDVVERCPRFHWAEVKGASSYEIEITTDGGAKIEEFYSNKTIFEANYNLPDTRLRWRVRARKDMATGKWSSWAYFIAEDTLEQAYVISPKGDEVVERRPRFHWTEVKGASNYEIEITTDGGAKIEEFYSKKITRKAGKDLPAIRFRWRVRARKDMATGKWSSWAYFTPKTQIKHKLYYQMSFPYLVIIVISIFLFALYSIFNKKIPRNFSIIF